MEKEKGRMGERNRIPIESKQETKKEETDTAISKNWKFRRPEPRKTLGKEIKEEVSSTSISNNPIINRKYKYHDLHMRKIARYKIFKTNVYKIRDKEITGGRLEDGYIYK